jgi:hypothetical protein
VSQYALSKTWVGVPADTWPVVFLGLLQRSFAFRRPFPSVCVCVCAYGVYVYVCVRVGVFLCMFKSTTRKTNINERSEYSA